MKQKLIFTLLAVFICLSAVAVTREEMEQARTITAQAFLRYMNNGSGYLDELNPIRVSDLKKSLKEKELQNLKTFESIAYPKIDVYQNWDKAQLVEFWSSKFFTDSKVPAEAQGAKSRVRAKINAMNISTTAEESLQDETATEQTDNITDKTQRILDSIATADSIAAEAAIFAALSEETQTDDSTSAPTEEFSEEETDTSKSKSSPTLLYSIILIVLVVIVVALVIYTIHSFKRGAKVDNSDDDRTESNEENAEEALAEYEAAITAKDYEITTLRAEIERLNNLLLQNAQTKGESYESKDIKPNISSRTIYLAYANNKGMFVRADSVYNEDYSIFKLVTTDGVTGSFSIINNPVAQKLAMSLPVSILSNACQSEDLQHGNWSKKIVTDNVGTAIFENGRWMVKRKADINFI